MSVDKAVDSSVLDGYFSDIADAIRAKNGSQSTYTPSQMPSAITNIPTGGDDFVVRFSWDSVNQVWTPDKTLTEVNNALIDEKEIVGTADYAGGGAQSELILEDDNPLTLIVRFVFFNNNICQNGNIFDEYVWDSNGFNLDYRLMPIISPNFETVAKTYTPTTSQQTETVTFDSNDYNGLQEVDITVNAMPSGTAGTPTATKGAVNNHAIAVTPSVTNTTGYITGGTKTGTAVSVSAGELVSGTYTVDSSGTKDVTNYANVSVPAGTAGSPALTVDAVQNHSKTIRSSVINSTGWITGGTKSGASTIVYASDLVSGTLSVSSNGQQDVTNYQYVDVSVSGGGGSDVEEGLEDIDVSPASTTLVFGGLSGEPTSFAVYYDDDMSTPSGTPYRAIMLVYDGTSLHAQTLTNTNNAQVSYDSSSFSHSYSNGTLTITSTSPQFISGVWCIDYSYGGTSGNIKTADTQVGSGATSITFTVDDEPLCWYLIFKSNFGTSSGYQRVIGIRHSDLVNNTYGYAMDSSAHLSGSYWTSSYSNGSLTITSQGTNAGGYFHQPGYYQLTYVVSGDQSLQTKTVTPTTSTQNVEADAGYTALKKVTVNPIPSSYVQPTATKGATTYPASTSDQTIASGTYLTGTQTIKGYAVQAKEFTSNGTYTPDNGFNGFYTVTVNVAGGGSSKNVQVLQSTSRANASSLTKVLGDLTVSKTGTYDIYWSGGRTNTSTSYTWGTRLYVDGSGYGTENTTWTNNCQSNHLSNVSLTANQKLSVYARGRTGSYYTFVPMLVIIEA